MADSKSHLVRFYLGEQGDHKGRFIQELWELEPFWLEHTHDYIQWLFPIDTKGRFNSFAPMLTAQDIGHFVSSDLMQNNQLKSLDMMLEFLGLVRVGDAISVSASLNMREHIWLKHGGHNHLRISRIIRSLALCRQTALAESLQACVIKAGNEIGEVSETSIQYWLQANKVG